MAKKCTNAEYEQRLTEVYQLLISGASRAKIQQYAATKWSLSVRPIDQMIAKVRRLGTYEQDVTRQEALAEELCVRDYLFNNAVKEKRWLSALMIADSRVKLMGLTFYTDEEVIKEFISRKSYKNIDGYNTY